MFIPALAMPQLGLVPRFLVGHRWAAGPSSVLNLTHCSCSSVAFKCTEVVLLCGWGTETSVLSSWRSDSPAWEIRGGAAWCWLPFALLLRHYCKTRRKGRRFWPALPVHMFLCSFTPCLPCLHPRVHRSVLYHGKKPEAKFLTLHGIFKAFKIRVGKVAPHGNDQELPW